MKYIEWLEDWLENYVRPSVKPRTYDRYAVVVRQHIAADLGRRDMEELTPLALQQFLTGLRAEATGARARDCPAAA